MNVWVGNVVPGVTVMVSAAEARATHTTWLRWLFFFVSSYAIQFFFVQKYPKSQALKWALKLRKGERVTIEGDK